MSDLPPRTGVRVEDVVTTVLDAVAFLAIAGGLGWVIGTGPYGPGAGVFFGGCLLAALSMASQWWQAPRPPKRPKRPDPAPLPGPEDPGNVHVKGF